MADFDILSIQPIRPDGLWKVQIAIGSPETVEGVDVAQVAKLTVRFHLRTDRSISDLLERAVSEARRALTLSLGAIEGKSAQELLDEAEVARNKSFELNFGIPT